MLTAWKHYTACIQLFYNKNGPNCGTYLLILKVALSSLCFRKLSSSSIVFLPLHILYCNIGNHQSLGQRPVIFFMEEHVYFTCIFLLCFFHIYMAPCRFFLFVIIHACWEKRNQTIVQVNIFIDLFIYQSFYKSLKMERSSSNT